LNFGSRPHPGRLAWFARGPKPAIEGHPNFGSNGANERMLTGSSRLKLSVSGPWFVLLGRTPGCQLGAYFLGIDAHRNKMMRSREFTIDTSYRLPDTIPINATVPI